MDHPAHTADLVLTELVSRLNWHQFRWSDWAFTPPPVNVENPCGDCGRDVSEHPIPRLNPAWHQTEELGRMIAAAAHIDGGGADD